MFKLINNNLDFVKDNNIIKFVKLSVETFLYSSII